MALFSSDVHDVSERAQKQLGRQVQALVRDAGHVSQSLSRFGAQASNDVGHMAMDAASQALQGSAEAARRLGSQAYRASKALRNDPLPAVVAVVGFACLLNLVVTGARRRQTRH